MNKPITVSELNNQIKGLLETTFTNVYVEGEISNLTYHSSGHIYFSVKDENSTISCVMFRGNAKSLKFRLEVGQKIIISGSITVYSPRGNYQLLCSKIEPSGAGALALAYEQLKTKLQIKGYFDSSLKKPLPKFPLHFAVVTSATGAAIEDMKKIALKRWPMAKMTLVPALVQGEGAAPDIVKAIKTADALDVDFIILGRGGGSIEDLWAFNEEMVADALFKAKTPIISAVGHESDFVISDFVADIRASTPSNAIEISTPDITELKIYIDTMFDDIKRRYLNILAKKSQMLEHTKAMFESHSFAGRFKAMESEIAALGNNFNMILLQSLNKKKGELDLLYKTYGMNDPAKKEKPGYAQLSKEGKIIDIKELSLGDEFFLESPAVVVRSKVLEVKNIS